MLKKQSLIVGFLLMAFALFLSSPAFTGEEKTKDKTASPSYEKIYFEEGDEDMIPEEVFMESDIYEERQRPVPIPFDHLKHSDDYKVACNDCHHIWKDGKNIWTKDDDVDACQNCHNLNTPKKFLNPAQTKNHLESMVHANCKGCHRQVIKENPEKHPPYKCNECHIK